MSARPNIRWHASPHRRRPARPRRVRRCQQGRTPTAAGIDRPFRPTTSPTRFTRAIWRGSASMHLEMWTTRRDAAPSLAGADRNVDNPGSRRRNRQHPCHADEQDRLRPAVAHRRRRTGRTRQPPAADRTRLTRAEAAANVDNGRWQRVHPGVYATFTGTIDPAQQVWAPVRRARLGRLLFDGIVVVRHCGQDARDPPCFDPRGSPGHAAGQRSNAPSSRLESRRNMGSPSGDSAAHPGRAVPVGRMRPAARR